MAEDVQFVLNNVLQLACRVPIEILWRRRRPRNYGEAYRSLLKNRHLLAVGLHRPPISNLDDPNSNLETRNPLHETRRGTCAGAVPNWEQYAGHGSSAGRNGGGARSAAATAEGQGRSLGGSRFLAIACPRASFPLRAGDCLFVLRQPSEVAAAAAARMGVDHPESGAGEVPKGEPRGAYETGSRGAPILGVVDATPPVEVAVRGGAGVSSNGGALDGENGTIGTVSAYENETGDGISPSTGNPVADRRAAGGAAAVDGNTHAKGQASAKQPDDGAVL